MAVVMRRQDEYAQVITKWRQFHTRATAVVAADDAAFTKMPATSINLCFFHVNRSEVPLVTPRRGRALGASEKWTETARESLELMTYH